MFRTIRDGWQPYQLTRSSSVQYWSMSSPLPLISVAYFLLRGGYLGLRAPFFQIDSLPETRPPLTLIGRELKQTDQTNDGSEYYPIRGRIGRVFTECRWDDLHGMLS